MKHDLLVSVEWLARHQGDPSLVIADVRWYLKDKRGRDAYAAGHIPGACFVDLETELAAPPGGARGGRHPLPAPDAVAAMLSRLGVTPTSHVVAYDDAGGSIAARLWWLLRYFGHDIVSLLDGGIQAWQSAGQPMAVEEPAPQAAPRLHLEPKSEHVVSAEQAERADVLLDARATERYTGATEPIDPRAGHIPGALSAPFADNLEGGRFRSRDELRRRFGALGAMDGSTVAAYCGSGVTACHDLFALALAGRPDAKLYAGSWSEWASDPSRPAATGEEPGG